MNILDVKHLRKEEIILLYKNLKHENNELRLRINKIISEKDRKKYMKEYDIKYRRKLKREKEQCLRKKTEQK